MDQTTTRIIALAVTAVWAAVNLIPGLSANSTYVNGVMLVVVGFYFGRVAYHGFSPTSGRNGNGNGGPKPPAPRQREGGE